MKEWIGWVVVGIMTLVISGIVGDCIFYPHPSHFSFTVLSGYGAALTMLVMGAILGSS